MTEYTRCNEFNNFCEQAAKRAKVSHEASLRQYEQKKTNAEREADDATLLEETKTAMRREIIENLKNKGFSGTDEEAEKLASHEVDAMKFHCVYGRVATNHITAHSEYYISCRRDL